MSARQPQRAYEGRAEFLDGWSLASRPVVATLDVDGLRISDASGSFITQWDGAGLSCDAMQVGVLHVGHASASHETLVVHDADLATAILEAASQRHVLPGGRRKLGFALACLAALVALGGAAYASVPVASRFIAQRIPLAQEQALGSQLAGVWGLASCPQAPAQQPLQALVQKLGGSGFDVHIANDRLPNAFALPGGSIIVTDALLREASSPDEVAGVLAHEIEHIRQRHVLAGMIRDAVLSGLWALTVGDYAGLLVVDPSTAYRVANLKYSREDEAAADEGAVKHLHDAGLSHRGLVVFFERLEAHYGDAQGPAWFSTHPSTASRIAGLKRIADVPKSTPALSEAEFALLQRGCD